MADRTWARLVAAYAGLVLVMGLVGALAGGGGDGEEALEALVPPEPRAAFPLETRSPQVAGGSNLRVLVALRRPALGDLPAEQRSDPARQRAYVRSLGREARALRSALEARGVAFGDPVDYARVWSGFAATVSTRDLTEVQAAGLRVEPVRRFFPASEGTTDRAPARPPLRTPPLRADPVVAVLDSEVDRRAVGRAVARVADLVGPARVPAGRGDEHGTQVAGVLAESLPKRARILAIRVSGLQPQPDGGGFEESGTTDQLLAGMERAVDPDSDGDATDAVAVALVGVVSPFAGFERGPEGNAARAAAALGTLTVAPAGNQGPGGGRFGTIGSPASAPAVLAVGALAGPVRVRPATVTIATAAGSTVVTGELIGGDARAAEGRVTARMAEARRAIVVTGGDPGPAAERALAAGARALVVCRPDGELPALLRAVTGPLPVIGLTGDAAGQALAAARAGDGLGEIALGTPDARLSRMLPARTSSAGPTYALGPKPDVVAAGSAVAPVAGGGRGYASGTSVAAARVAAQAALLRAARPELAPGVAAALLAETGSRRPGTGIGRADAIRAASTGVVALPHALRLRPGGVASVTLRNDGKTAVRARIRPGRLRAPAVVRVRAGGERRLRIRAPRGAHPGPRAVRVVAGREELWLQVFVAPPAPPARVGALALQRDAGRVEGVRFAAGRLTRVGGAPAVEPVGTLVLRLTGPEDRELTPPGGARDLLPAEYAYTLSRNLLEGLQGGSYRFVVTARGPAGGAVVTRRSPTFRLR